MKRVLVLYDTKYGNTERLAEEIGKGIEEAGEVSVVVQNYKEFDWEDIPSFDAVLFGSPVHIFRATRGIIGAVKKAVKVGLTGKIVGAFETYLAEGHEGKAVHKIEKELKKSAPDAKLYSEGLPALVKGYEGPLGDDVLPKALEFGRGFGAKVLS